MMTVLSMSNIYHIPYENLNACSNSCSNSGDVTELLLLLLLQKEEKKKKKSSYKRKQTYINTKQTKLFYFPKHG